MSYAIRLERERCIACGACAVACMDEKDLDPRRGDPMLRRCESIETGEGPDARIRYTTVSCLHCPDAPCVAACPRGCLYRDGDTGFVLYDNSRCVGCRRCREVCPVSAPDFDSRGRMHKCDGCADRVRQGLLPACVKVCPMDALRLIRT